MKELFTIYLQDGFTCWMGEIEKEDREKDEYRSFPIGAKIFRLRNTGYIPVEFPVIPDTFYSGVK